MWYLVPIARMPDDPDGMPCGKTKEIVWTPFAIEMAAGELAVIVLALAFAANVTSRKRDYI